MEPVFHNRTRRAESIPRKLITEGKPYLLPIYFLMLTSDLAAEGIRNSGSYRFADHIYAGKPGGRFGIGWLLDAIMLKMPSARAFWARYNYSKQEILRLAHERSGEIDVLAVPSGLAREIIEAATELKAQAPQLAARMRWHGVDLDPEVIDLLSKAAKDAGVEITLSCGDALDPASYPQRYDMIISLGFAEFVPDDKLVDFYRLARTKLKPGGRLVTSGMLPHRLSDYLLRNIGELHTFYRSAEQLRALAQQAGFPEGRTYRDATGLQAMLIAEETP